MFKKENLMKILFLSLIFLFFTGCTDKSISKLYDKSYKNTVIPCLKLSISPDNSTMDKTLKNLYPFKEKCQYLFLVSYKTDIVCNSNQNAPRKTLSNFPNGFLRIQINKSMNHLIYSYYIDLNDDVDKGDLIKGFENIDKNLKIRGENE